MDVDHDSVTFVFYSLERSGQFTRRKQTLLREFMQESPHLKEFYFHIVSYIEERFDPLWSEDKLVYDIELGPDGDLFEYTEKYLETLTEDVWGPSSFIRNFYRFVLYCDRLRITFFKEPDILILPQ